MIDDQSGIRRFMVEGAGWIMLFKAVNRGIGLISTMILARPLVPEDYSIVAMSMSVSAE